MSTIPVVFVKLRLLTERFQRIVTEEREPFPEGIDPRIPLTQEVLDNMAQNREYYKPTVITMSAYYNYKFKEVNRDRSHQRNFYSTYQDGCLFISNTESYRFFAGNLRKSSRGDYRGKMHEPSIDQLIGFCTYLDIMSNRNGRIEVESGFRTDFNNYEFNNQDYVVPREWWNGVIQHFTADEIVTIEASNWLARVDTPAE